MSKSTSRSTVLLAVIILSFAVAAAAAAPMQGQVAPGLQIPGMTPQRPDVVEGFLRQYAQEHPLAPGVSGQQPVPPSQSVNVLRPNLIPPQSRQQGPVCSIPLLRAEIDRTQKYSVHQVTPPAIDQSMLKKPASPSCEEKRSNRKP
jgi:hypothetical protein